MNIAENEIEALMVIVQQGIDVNKLILESNKTNEAINYRQTSARAAAYLLDFQYFVNFFAKGHIFSLEFFGYFYRIM